MDLIENNMINPKPNIQDPTRMGLFRKTGIVVDPKAAKTNPC
jgi:hypothetical protein